MKKIGILGSTGSIGRNAIDVIKRNKDRFKIVFLSAYSNVQSLFSQTEELKPDYVCILREDIRIPEKVNFKIRKGFKECKELVDLCDTILIATTGTSAYSIFFYALEKKKIVAMANKEILVSFSDFITDEHRNLIIPVDSEHSAIFQALKAGRKEDLKRIILTASGGPFKERKNLEDVKVEEALKHPRWKMGEKITIDSATLFNKGLEAHEAKALFNVSPDMIDVIIHPESIVHSIVEFKDGSMIAQMSVPDMRIPIQYALTYPERIESNFPSLNLLNVKTLNFSKPDFERFPMLKLALDVLRMGKTYPVVMNKADEIAVKLFLQKKIKFKEIHRIVEDVISKHNPPEKYGIEDIIKIEEWVEKNIKEIK
uniref:1-deoxy-D-xylulose 5-phosphate reductoisomerase n=1 Tax=candidate division WOR-3 bacterium TaxID=2052148 RepID=A0A7C4Y9Z4_UNCW3